MTIPVDQQNVYVAIWAKAIDTQMHFNEMSVKSRQFGLGFVAAALGIGIVFLVKGEQFSLPIHIWGGFDINGVVFILLASAFALYAVSILDLHVYHKMLRGAVAFGEDFEENYMKKIFDLRKGMTQTVSHFSRHEDAHIKLEDGKHSYCGCNRKDALTKIKNFYRFSIWSLIIMAGFLFYLTANFGHPGQTTVPQNPVVNDEPVPNAK
jgi:hypothetical protein